MSWSIQEVARMAKVSSRTLRHYDEIGLLPPAWTGANGYRYYERDQLLRLQQILLLREHGLGLEAIGQVLDGGVDQVEALRRHQRWLLAERDRLGQLIHTVANTIAQLEGDAEMAEEDWFEGFTHNQARLEEDLVERYGEGVREQFETSRQATAGWTKQDYFDAQEGGKQLDARLLELLRAGTPVNDPRVFEVLDEHHAAVAQFWTPDRTSYTGLGQLYVDNPEFRAHYDAQDPGMAEFLRDAIAAYAQARLA